MPVKDAFDWIYDQNEKLGGLTMQCLNDVDESYGKFGQHIVRWYRDEDLPDAEPRGLCNLASHLVADQLAAKGIECSVVYASRDDEWIGRNLDFPRYRPQGRILYAVCDITRSFEPVLENFNFSETTDGLVRCVFNDKPNAYIEVLSFSKIVNDAKMRNGIFFDKLGLPS